MCVARQLGGSRCARPCAQKYKIGYNKSWDQNQNQNQNTVTVRSMLVGCFLPRSVYLSVT
jgi:hypothetical protein